MAFNLKQVQEGYLTSTEMKPCIKNGQLSVESVQRLHVFIQIAIFGASVLIIDCNIKQYDTLLYQYFVQTLLNSSPIKKNNCYHEMSLNRAINSVRQSLLTFCRLRPVIRVEGCLNIWGGTRSICCCDDFRGKTSHIQPLVSSSALKDKLQRDYV